MKASSWTVFFFLRPLTTIHTTILTDLEDVEENILISLAKSKIQTELGLDIDLVAERLGKNENFGTGWIALEQNDITPTEYELEVLPINKLS